MLADSQHLETTFICSIAWDCFPWLLLWLIFRYSHASSWHDSVSDLAGQDSLKCPHVILRHEGQTEPIVAKQMHMRDLHDLKLISNYHLILDLPATSVSKAAQSCFILYRKKSFETLSKNKFRHSRGIRTQLAYAAYRIKPSFTHMSYMTWPSSTSLCPFPITSWY